MPMSNSHVEFHAPMNLIRELTACEMRRRQFQVKYNFAGSATETVASL